MKKVLKSEVEVKKNSINPFLKKNPSQVTFINQEALKKIKEIVEEIFFNEYDKT